MIEMTTGLVFFISSVYGASTTTVAQANEIINSNVATTSIETRTLEDYLQEYFKEEPIMVKIAKCESTFMHYDKTGNIVRGRVDNNDVGVMQINERYHLEDSKKLGFDIHSLEGNLAYAKYLYYKFGTKPWRASQKCWDKYQQIALK